MEQFSTKPQASAARQEKVVLRRIRAIDIEIRSGTYPNTNDLAKKLEVGVRTISRDIEEMKLFYNAPLAFCNKKSRTNIGYFKEVGFFAEWNSLS